MGLSEQARQKRAEAREKLSGEVEQLEGALAGKVAGLGRARRALSVTVEQVRAAIPERAALIELLRYHHYLGREGWEERYGAAVLTHSEEPKWVCLGAAATIETNVLFYQQFVRSRKDEAGLSFELQALYRQLWAPLEAILPADTKTIIISPDAGLNFISFATLLTPDNQFLVQKYSIRYVASGRDILRPAKTPPTNDMVIFAAPDYSGDQASAPRNPELYLEPLPNSAPNAAALEAQAKSWNWPVHVFLGTAATESRLRTVHSPRILHLSTHGFLLPEKIRGAGRFSYFSFITDPNGFQKQVILLNPMYRSGVALAGAQVTLDAWTRGEIPNTDNDGILTAEKVGSLDLQNTWLVVLSACDTGIGELRYGEGVMGLRRGFVQAGTQNLLMTLWPVFDRTSGDFMLDFYSAVQKSGNAPEALANVQRDWLLTFRKKHGLLPAVVLAGPFILSSQGPVE